jgi:hypothetical protein
LQIISSKDNFGGYRLGLFNLKDCLTSTLQAAGRQRDIHCLENGTVLANRLNDWDDIFFLKNAAKKLKEIDSLPPRLSWLHS